MTAFSFGYLHEQESQMKMVCLLENPKIRKSMNVILFTLYAATLELVLKEMIVLCFTDHTNILTDFQWKFC